MERVVLRRLLPKEDGEENRGVILEVKKVSSTYLPTYLPIIPTYHTLTSRSELVQEGMKLRCLLKKSLVCMKNIVTPTIGVLKF